MNFHSRSLVRIAIPLLIVATFVQRAACQDLGVVLGIDADGLYRVTMKDLEGVIDYRTLDIDRLTLMDGSKLLPLQCRGTSGAEFKQDGSFIFYAERSDSMHSRRRALRLAHADGPPRLGVTAAANPPRDMLEDSNVRVRFEEDVFFDAMETVRGEVLFLPPEKKTHWFWKRISPPSANGAAGNGNSQSFALELVPQPRTSSYPGQIEIGIRSHWGRQGAQSMRVSINGKEIGESTWTDEGNFVVRLTLPAEHIQRTMVVDITNTSKDATWDERENQVTPKHRNDILVDWIALQYRALLVGPASGAPPQIIYDLPEGRFEGSQFLKFRALTSDRPMLYDVAAKTFIDKDVIERKSTGALRLVAALPDGLRKPVDIRAQSPRRLKSEKTGGDWVVVTLERFRDLLLPIKDHRRAQGLTPFVVTDREVYDSFSGGNFTPEAIRDFIAHARKNWEIKPRYILLIGDADHDVDWTSEKPTLPTMLVETYYNGKSASDAAFIEDPMDQNIAIGRWPVRREDEVITWIKRTIRYENQPAPGDWRKRLSFIASEGRFGPLIDPIIEAFVVDMLSKHVPAGYDVNMTYASPSSQYVYAPRLFNAKVIDRFNEGSLFYTYIGHGYRRGFDALQVAKERFPIMTMDDIRLVNAENRNPIMSVIACSTANFDEPKEDCITEELLKQAGGPSAVIAATRISHPFSNALLGKGLIQSFFDGTERIGDVMTRAKIKMAKEWQKDPIANMASSFVAAVDKDRLMRDHVHLYVLLGDPAMTIPRPANDISLTHEASATFGSTLKVSGMLAEKVSGKALVSVDCRRQDILRPMEKVNLRDPADDEKVNRNYEVANDKRLVHVEVDVVDGKFDAELQLPAEARPGPYFVKAAAICGDRLSLGSGPISLTK